MSGSTDAIDAKKKENDAAAAPSTSHWGPFLVQVLQNMVFLAIFAVLGANFIYFTRTSKLDMLFPTDPSLYFGHIPPKPPKGAQKGGQRGGLNMSAVSTFGLGKNLHGWPYSMHTSNESGFSWESWKNWFGSSIGESYIGSRGLLKTVFEFFAPAPPGKDANMFSNELFLMFFGNIFLQLAAILAFFAGAGGFLFRSFTNKYWGWQWGLIGLFLGYTLFTSATVGSIQALQLFLTLVFIPLFIDHAEVGRIIMRNVNALGWIFGLLVISSALQFLEWTTSTVMMIAFIIMAIKSYFF